METKAKKKTFNIIMAVLIVLVVGCGIMAVGNLKGWFGGNDESKVVPTKVEESTGTEQSSTVSEQNGSTAVSEEGVSSESDKTISTCTIQIQCKSILNHMDKLKEGKNKYIPSSGTILATSEVEFNKEESAYDVTKRACNAAGIQMEAAYTPVYSGYYVEGINHLYEFDCGQSSGWMYKVNGWSPNYGCSEYTLKNGDSIVWYYTCTGN